MNAALIDDLPVLTRLALAYAPRSAKPATAALFALDRQLGSIARTSSEPMLAQLRYAWWRDALGQQGGAVPRGNPLLDAVAAWGERRAMLGALVDGWEALATDENLFAGASALIAARAGAGAALACALGAPHAAEAAALAARQWALADLIGNVTPGPGRDQLKSVLSESVKQPPRLPRSLRTLAVLATIARHQSRDQGAELRPGPSILLSAVRTGLFGR